MPATPPAALPRLGWSLVLRIAAGLLVPILLTLTFTPEASLAAVGGALLGAVGSLVGSSRRSLLGAAVLLGLLGLDHWLPGSFGLLPIALILALAAGVESATTGGRSLTMALFGAVMLAGAVFRDGAAPSTAAMVFAASLVYGALLAVTLNLHGRAALPANSARGGIEQAVFLCAGLLLTQALMAGFDTTQALWTAQMFVMRAMASPDLSPRRSLQYVAGAAIGAGLAAAWQELGLTAEIPWLRLLLAAVFLLLGLRYAIAARVFSAAALTLAVLLSSAATPGQALIRFEAAGLSALLALLLLLALQVLGAWLWRPRDP
ncbi:hypothetical protein AB0T83_03080 [Fluviibacterium sp. DFM31]|uniref:FUSC family protein n=1 Tax=Meridianimarinicoccus marinus TaxID=3231483 RepID=A0ABV3L3T4_9RHOB